MKRGGFFSCKWSRKAKDADSITVNTSSDLSNDIRESKAGTTLSGFLKLSTELILEIADYLPPSSYMSLSYSCRRIQGCMGASIEHVLGDTAVIRRQKAAELSIEMRNIQSVERLE